ncbi:MAG: response regulator [Elusimicrobiota bacterium]
MPLRIMIVDDSPAARFMLREFIESNGHQVVAEEENLEGTLRSYSQHKPDVVTLDLSLAQGDGLSVLKAVRNLDPKAKVLVISGNSQKKVVDVLYAAGASGFLPKPIDFPGLMAAIIRVTLR